MSKLLLIIFIFALASCQFKNADQGSSLVAGHTPTTNNFSIANPSSGIYRESQNIDFYFNFPYAVTVTGSPRVVLNVGGATRYATYLSGSDSEDLVFRYTVLAGDNDNDGISASTSLDLNGGTLSFTGTNGTESVSTSLTIPSLTNVRVDTTSPTLTVNSPTNGTYYRDMPINFTVSASEAAVVTGTPRIPVNINGTTRFATYVSGSGSTSLIFRYTVSVADYDMTGIETNSPAEFNGGSIRDIAGNLATLVFTPPNTSSVLVDGQSPYVKQVIPPTNGTYTFNQSVDFTLRFNEAVTVGSGGTPLVTVNVEGTTRNAVYISGSGSSDLVFRYVVQADDIDLNGVALGSSIDLSGSSIRNAASVNAVLAFLPGSSPGVLVNAPSPRILSFVWNDGLYTTGSNIYITAIFDRIVNVTGLPRLALNIGGITKYATYDLGSGSTNIRFAYEVQSGDADLDGIQITSPLSMNGGTIRDAQLMNTLLTFTPPNTPNLRVQSDVPYITSITPPADDTYFNGEHLDFTVNYSAPVFVDNSGLVKLSLNVGGFSREASYLSGTGTSALVFRYTAQASDLDMDGIILSSPVAVTSPGLIRDSGATPASLTFSPPSMPNVLVNVGLVAPEITLVTPPLNASYKLGDNIDISIQFSENVFVVGSPQLPITVGATPRFATYLSGSASNTLIFRYTVPSGDLDIDGITPAANIELNGGTIRDSDSLNSALALTSSDMTGILVDGIVPTITNMTGPAAATYSSGEALNFTATFSENVNIIGTPRIQLNVGGAVVYANYVSGTGTSSVVFRYTVQVGDTDGDGIGSTSPLNLNGGTIRDLAGNNSSLSFTVPNTSLVNVNGTTPTISSVGGPTAGTYSEGNDLTFVFNMSTTAVVSGTPRIALDIGGVTRHATYVSGSGTNTLTFTQTVQDGDNDNNGIQVTSTDVDLNGGLIQTTGGVNFALGFTPPSTTTVFVDTTDPTIISVTAPVDGNYNTAQVLNFNVDFSENVTVTGTPRIMLDFGGTMVPATYVSGTGSSTLVFRRTVQMGDFDNNGITVGTSVDLNGGTIRDVAGNNAILTFSAPNTSGITVNLIIPTISSATAPNFQTYGASQNLNFTFTMSENAIVTGTPRVVLTIGSTTRYANYFSGSGTTSLVFRYTTQIGDNDSDGIQIATPLDLNGGTLKNGVGTDFNLAYTLPNTTGVRVDTTTPTLDFITPPAANSYGLTQQLEFTANFSESVDVTGTPRIQINIGGTTRYATFVSGSGSANLLFRYTIVGGDTDNDGIGMISPLELNGGTIQDSAGNNSSLTYSLPVTSGVLVDTVAPTITGMTGPIAGTYNATQTLDFTTTFSEAVIIGGIPRLTLTIGATTRYANYQSGSGTSSIIFRYTPTPGDMDTNGIAVASPVDLNAGSIRDLASNNSSLTFTPPNTSAVNIDTVAPTIISRTWPNNGTYAAGGTLSFTFTFSENVTVVGNPRLAFVIGTTTRFATYQSGSGTSTLSFSYSVISGEYDDDGIVMISPLELNGGTIRDTALNNATLTYTLPNTTAVIVDAVLPAIVSISPSGDGNYFAGSPITFDVLFTKTVNVAGSPSVAIVVNGTTRQATYASGTGTSTIRFSYNPGTDELDLNGLTFATSSISLNGGTIRDISNANATLTYPSTPSLAGINVIFSTMTNWYDLSDTSKITVVNDGVNDVISQITDKIGTTNITATGTARPRYFSSGYGTGNTAYAGFNGSTNVMNFGTLPLIRSAVFVFRSRSTLAAFTLMDCAASPNQTEKLFIGSTGANNITLHTGPGGNGARGDFRANSGAFTTSYTTTKTWAWTINTNYILHANYNAIQCGVGSPFGSTNFNGQIAEVILLNAEPTATQADVLRAWLNTKHGAY